MYNLYKYMRIIWYVFLQKGGCSMENNIVKRASRLIVLIEKNIKELHELIEKGKDELAVIEKELYELKNSNYTDKEIVENGWQGEVTVVEKNNKELDYQKDNLESFLDKGKRLSLEINTMKKELDGIIKELKKRYKFISSEEIIGVKVEDLEKKIQETKKIEESYGKAKELLTTAKDLIAEVKPIADEERRKRSEAKKKAKEELVKKEILSDKENEMVYVRVEDSGTHIDDRVFFEGIVPKKLLELSRKHKGIFLPTETHISTDYGPHDDYTDTYDLYIKEVPYEKCSLGQKNMINEKRKKLEELSRKIAEDKTGKYDKVGKAKIPICSEGDSWENAKKTGELSIEITQRELVEVGLLPEDLEWKRGKITSKDIAQAGIAKQVEKGEEKSIWGKLINKVKDMINGRGR